METLGTLCPTIVKNTLDKDWFEKEFKKRYGLDLNEVLDLVVTHKSLFKKKVD
jgi:hypothetical protein